ncbi:MAG: chemotaxis protein CheW [Deltaproteobacteria bacterium]|nr:chemotaxis protein CheW [Deltaproteobacteria bacterium]
MSAPGQSSESVSVRLCSFQVGEETYVVDIMRIQEIVNPLPVTALRSGSEVIEGVIDLRGQVVPLVDLRRQLGLSPSVASHARKQMIVNVGGKLVAFLVDAMGRVIEVSRDEIQRTESVEGSAAAELFPGALRHKGTLYLLLDLQAVMERGGVSEGDLP